MSGHNMRKSRLQFRDGVCVDTPCVVLPTYMGNLLFTPPSLADPISPHIVRLGQLELTDVIEKDFGDIPLSQLCVPAAPGGTGPRLIMSCRSMTRGCGVGTKLGVDVDAPGGRKTITPKKLATRVRIDQPLAVVALADEVCMTSGHKRLSKSTDRTLSMFRELMALPEMGAQEAQEAQREGVFVFGVAVSGHTTDHLPNMAARLVQQGARGVVIGGANLGETPEQLSEACQRVRAAIGDDVPMMLQGVDSMAAVMCALASGVDLCSSNLVQLASQLGHALVLPLPMPPAEAAADGSEGGTIKRPRTERGEKMGQGQGTDSGVSVGRYGPAIILWQERYRKDQTPISSHCRCHTCSHHTRAYLHHLLKAKELLADVLIYQHNQHQVMQLFEAVRAAQWSPEDFAEWSGSLVGVDGVDEV